MSSIDRPLSGDVQRFDLDRERERAEDPAILERSGRSARTLLKSGPLRVTLVVIAAGGEISEHEAPGPVTIHPLSGRLRLTVGGEEREAGPGELVALGPGVRHAVASEEGATFLLTVAAA